MDGDKGVAAIELAAALGDKKIVLISQPYRLHSQNDGISPDHKAWICFRLQPQGPQSEANGISPDLKNMPPACFLPRFARPVSSIP